jgi:DNA-binding transcriptional LysR family regulator
MKQWYDRDGRLIEFELGEKVLVLLPVSDPPLLAKHFCPTVIESLFHTTACKSP